MTIFLVPALLFLGIIALKMVQQKPATLLRPSFVIWAGYYIFYLIPLALYGEQLQAQYVFVNNLAGYFILFLALLLVLINRTFNNKADAVLKKVIQAKNVNWNTLNITRLKIATIIPIFIIFSIYFTIVPFNTTGLYVLFTDPERSQQARENTLKLLTSQELKYAITGMLEGWLPILGVIVTLQMKQSIAKARLYSFSIAFVSFIVCLALVSISSARSPAIQLVLGCGIAISISKWGSGIGWKLALLAPFLIIIPVSITMVREGNLEASFTEYLSIFFFHRLVEGPLEVAIWYVDYAERYGALGIKGIPKLAALFGEQVIDLPNVIGKAYAVSYGETISANTGYVFSYFAMFGYFSLVICLLLTIACDFVLYGLLKCSRLTIIPASAALIMSWMTLIASDYSTVWFSHGVVPVLIWVWVINILEKKHLINTQ